VNVYALIVGTLAPFVSEANRSRDTAPVLVTTGEAPARLSAGRYLADRITLKGMAGAWHLCELVA